MTNQSPDLREVYHGPGVVAQLGCGAEGCLLELFLNARRFPSRIAVVEILYQGVDRWGIAEGPAVVTLRETVPLTPAPKNRLQGVLWLPKHLQPAILTRCYFRVTPQENPP